MRVENENIAQKAPARAGAYYKAMCSCGEQQLAYLAGRFPKGYSRPAAA
ncbi:hypothetical protein [Paenibacillus konkukensis]|nr:hypothetical protein [Paenibacillus konkukensis]